jgi:hypothetical protein
MLSTCTQESQIPEDYSRRVNSESLRVMWDRTQHMQATASINRTIILREDMRSTRAFRSLIQALLVKPTVPAERRCNVGRRVHYSSNVSFFRVSLRACGLGGQAGAAGIIRRCGRYGRRRSGPRTRLPNAIVSKAEISVICL